MHTIVEIIGYSYMALLSRRISYWSAALIILCSLFVVSPSQSQQDAGIRRRLLERSAPAYPSLARTMALRGVVRVEAVVSPDGNVKTVEVKGGHPILVQAAINSVRSWKWESASRETREPIEVKFGPEIVTP